MRVKMEIFEPLERWIEGSLPLQPDPETGKTPTDMLHGRRGPLGFILSADEDGQVEASLSILGRKPGRSLPTDAHVAAFFRAWGREPVFEETGSREVCRHFVLVLGSRHIN